MKRKLLISIALLALIIAGLVWFFGFNQAGGPTDDSQASSDGPSLTAEAAKKLAEKLVSQDEVTYKEAWAHDNIPPVSPRGTTVVIDKETVASYEVAGVASATITLPGEDPVEQAVLYERVEDEWLVYGMQDVASSVTPRIGIVPSVDEKLKTPYASVAAAGEPACVSDLGINAPAPKDAVSGIPVIVVHGLNSDKDAWLEGSPSFDVTLKSIPNAVLHRFDYKLANDRWVADSDAAHNLAKTIVCYSKLYDGKDVILVGHSMGGLLILEALDWAAYGTYAKDVTSDVITIATPYKGSRLANIDSSFWVSVCKAPLALFGLITDVEALCREAESGRATSGLSIDSDQLAELPDFPEDITVKAIAGDVKWHVCAPWGCSDGVSTGGDLVVSVESATAKGDSEKVFTCETTIPVAMISPAWCEHSNMLQASQVQEEVKKTIEESLGLSDTDSSDEPLSDLPPHEIVEMFGKLNFPYLHQWGGAMSEPDAVMNIVDNTNCSGSNADCPHIQVINLDSEYGRSTYGDDPVAAAVADYCFAESGGAYGQLELKATIDIDGEEAHYYEQAMCPPGIMPQTMQYVWYIPSQGILISGGDSENGAIEIEDLQAAIANIEWL